MSNRCIIFYDRKEIQWVDTDATHPTPVCRKGVARGHPKPLCILFSDTKGLQSDDTDARGGDASVNLGFHLPFWVQYRFHQWAHYDTCETNQLGHWKNVRSGKSCLCAGYFVCKSSSRISQSCLICFLLPGIWCITEFATIA